MFAPRQNYKRFALFFFLRFLSSTIVATLCFLFLELAGLIQRVIWNREHDAPLILPENMLYAIKSRTFHVFRCDHAPPSKATRALYPTKALALQRAKHHRANFRDTRDISSSKC